MYAVEVMTEGVAVMEGAELKRDAELMLGTDALAGAEELGMLTRGVPTATELPGAVGVTV